MSRFYYLPPCKQTTTKWHHTCWAIIKQPTWPNLRASLLEHMFRLLAIPLPVHLVQKSKCICHDGDGGCQSLDAVATAHTPKLNLMKFKLLLNELHYGSVLHPWETFRQAAAHTNCGHSAKFCEFRRHIQSLFILTITVSCIPIVCHSLQRSAGIVCKWGPVAFEFLAIHSWSWMHFSR